MSSCIREVLATNMWQLTLLTFPSFFLVTSTWQDLIIHYLGFKEKRMKRVWDDLNHNENNNNINKTAVVKRNCEIGVKDVLSSQTFL